MHLAARCTDFMMTATAGLLANVDDVINYEKEERGMRTLYKLRQRHMTSR